MLLKFKVKNFRSIKDEVVLDMQATPDKAMINDATFVNGEVSLLKTVAIYGPNASGKSNILKAYAVFRMMILESLLRSNNQVDLPNDHFRLSSETENMPSSFELSFVMDDKIFSYGCEIRRDKVVAEWLDQEKGNVNLFKRSMQEITSNKNSFNEATMALKKNTGERVLFLTMLASYNTPIAKKIVNLIQNTNYVAGTERGSTLNYSFGQFIKNENMAQKMKDLMRMADFGISDIRASEKMILAKDIKNIPDKFKEEMFKEGSKIAERNIEFIHKKYNSSNEEIGEEALNYYSDESEGTQIMFALSAPIIDTLENGKILFIDEIDASLHPSLCQYLVTLFNSAQGNPHKAQLVFTTHDTSFLSEDFLRRDQIYFTDKNKQGATKLFSLADISERKGLNFAKRYLEGRYNALPYISDFENIKFSK